MRVILATLGVFAAIALAACKQSGHPSDRPLSFWADPNNGETQDKCVIATAQAILKSGLPYPNITTETYTDAKGNTQIRNKTVDVWVGSTRYVLPAGLARDNAMYPANHPGRFWKLGGSLPNFYPPGKPGPEMDGMGSMVDVTIVCSMEPEYLASWGKGYQSNDDGVMKVKERYQKDLERRGKDKWPSARVSVNRRGDLRMLEVLYERGGTYNDGQPMWEASYWPLGKELKGPSGSVSGIGCQTRHDPLKRYGKRGWRCTSGMALLPEASIRIDLYVSQIEHMPAIFDQVHQLFDQSRQP